jgi:hypothetical protein
MHRSKLCSALLVPSSAGDPIDETDGIVVARGDGDDGSGGGGGGGAGSGSGGGSGGGDGSFVFPPGHFACDSLFSLRLPLHPRLQARSALRAVGRRALQPLSVRNRADVYVYQEQATGRVFYLRLTTETTTAAAASTLTLNNGHDDDDDDDYDDVVTPTAAATAASPPHFFASPIPTTTAAAAAAAAGLSTPAGVAAARALRRSCLVLDVHGVAGGAPGPDLRQQLTSRLKGCLDALTLASISQRRKCCLVSVLVYVFFLFFRSRCH